MIAFLALAILTATVSADTTVTLTCGPCPSRGGTCLAIKGGPFDNVEAPYNQACQFSSAEYLFNCNSGNCGGKCEVTATRSGGTRGNFGQSVCADSVEGKATTTFLDIAYSAIKGNRNLDSKYDWCACGGGGLSGGAIAGIVIGSVVFLILLGLLVWWCLKKRKPSCSAAPQQQPPLAMYPSPSERAAVANVNTGPASNHYGEYAYNQNGGQAYTPYGGWAQTETRFS